jgi:hypothetical protein
MALYLREHLTFDRANMVVESVSEQGNDLKTLYMKGIFIQGGVKNANERVYPVSEIETAVDTLNKQIQEGYSVLGEVDHPDDLKINLDHKHVDGWRKRFWKIKNSTNSNGSISKNNVGEWSKTRRFKSWIR